MRSALDLLVQVAEGLERRAELQQELARMDSKIAAQVHLAASAVSRLMEPVPKRTEPRRPLLSAVDVGKRVGVDAKTVRRWKSEGKLPPALVVAGVVRWEPDAIEASIAEGMQP